MPRRLGSRCLVALLMLYVGADFCDPFLPGAFSFNPDHSVVASVTGEPRQALMEESGRVDSLDEQPHVVPSTSRLIVPAPVSVCRIRPLAEVSRSHLDGHAAAPAAPGEDH